MSACLAQLDPPFVEGEDNHVHWCVRFTGHLLPGYGKPHRCACGHEWTDQ